MNISWKPEGYTSVAPYLVVHGAQKVIDFLKKAFIATELRRYERPDGTIVHAELRIDDTVVMIADGKPDWPASPCHLHVYVENVDETYRRAIAAGGVSVQEPLRKDDPDRRGGFKDPAGNSWWVATQEE